MIQDLATLEAQGDGRFTGSFDASWCQGPGIYGGLVAAALGRCAERTVEGRPVRTLSVQLCAPLLPGPFEIVVKQERRGSFVSFVSARILQNDRPAVLAQLVLGGPRKVDGDFHHSVAPEFPLPHTLPDLGRAPGVPAFTQHFEMRFVGGIPFSGQDRALTQGWMRPVRPEALNTSLQLALLDTWPLAVLPMFRGPRPAASIAIQFQRFVSEVPMNAWYRVQVESRVQQGGYSEQSGRIWAPDGTLIGLSHQLVVRLK